MSRDAQDLLSLYEAAYLRVHGEDILEEALEVTKTKLAELVPHLAPSLANKCYMLYRALCAKPFQECIQGNLCLSIKKMSFMIKFYSNLQNSILTNYKGNTSKN